MFPVKRLLVPLPSMSGFTSLLLVSVNNESFGFWSVGLRNGADLKIVCALENVSFCGVYFSWLSPEAKENISCEKNVGCLPAAALGGNLSCCVDK